nr:uncharacterized protein LOC112697924 isoform X3 [Arachis hypogaea]XP_029149578.1 uncharacterized protein LOC112756226 isoform X3 [Arachis hypogaea]
MTVSSLLFTAAAASAAALIMLYKGRRKSLLQSPHIGDLTTLCPPSERECPCGKILFVSRIRTSKALAQQLRDMLASNGIILDLVDTVDYEPEDLAKENLVLIVASTAEHWNRYPLRGPIITKDIILRIAAEEFAEWLKERVRSFEGEVFAVKACTFSAFGVVGRFSEDGKNLMAKAANHIRDLGHATQFNNDFDFDNWWQRAVGILKGAVLEDTVSDGKCEESEPELFPKFQDVSCSDPKLLMPQRFYVFVENFEEEVYTTYTRRMLTVTEANLMKNGSVDLEEADPVAPQWPLAKSIRVDERLPMFLGFCSVGGVLYFAGGMVHWILPKKYQVGSDVYYPKNLWCLENDGSTWISSIRGNTFKNGTLVVPYHGKLLIFGADWVEIYDPKSDYWDRREVTYKDFFQGYMDLQCYFLWKDNSTKNHKTLLFLYFFDDRQQSLMSYDVEANIWKPIECRFPPIRDDVYVPRKLLRLGSTDYLLIIDFAATWYVYDLSKKIVLADLHIGGLDDTLLVLHVFCCHCTRKESLVCIFMEPCLDYDLPDFVPYARVKLQIEGIFSAEVESKGDLKLGPYPNSTCLLLETKTLKGRM